jgi:6-phosphogluconolactonase/glucosamine-6-phosphate isomerase/deaminase
MFFLADERVVPLDHQIPIVCNQKEMFDKVPEFPVHQIYGINDKLIGDVAAVAKSTREIERCWDMAPPVRLLWT